MTFREYLVDITRQQSDGQYNFRTTVHVLATSEDDALWFAQSTYGLCFDSTYQFEDPRLNTDNKETAP